MPLTSATSLCSETASTKRKRSLTTPDSSPPGCGFLHFSAAGGNSYSPRKRMTLRIDTSIDNDINSLSSTSLSCSSDVDSLFDELESDDAPAEIAPEKSSPGQLDLVPASLTAPPVKGLFFPSSVRIPDDTADEVLQYCMQTYFSQPHVNQVMLFGRAPSIAPSSSSSGPGGIPTVLLSLLSQLSALLLPILPPHTHAILFPVTPTMARQVIVNLYRPGEGISAHVDLLQRYGDGIVGVSLGSGCVMRFCKVLTEGTSSQVESGDSKKDAWDLFLDRNSVLVLSEDARYHWTHEIGSRTEDYVSYGDGDDDDEARRGGRWIKRGLRISVTFRWLLPGADVVGTKEI